jgi:S-adenosylmethionine synthetase
LLGVHVNTFGTGKVSDEKLEKYILANFDMRPKALIDELGLLAPIYRPTSAYGHFGRSEFSWEKTTRAAKVADDLLGKVSATKVKNGAHLTHVGAELNGFANGSSKNGAHAVAKDAKAGKSEKAGKAAKKGKKKAKSLVVSA